MVKVVVGAVVAVVLEVEVMQEGRGEGGEAQEAMQAWTHLHC